MFNLFKKKNSNIQHEWQTKGAEYASAINEMVRFAETHGWDKWKGSEPSDNREHLAETVLALLKEANEKGETKKFRQDFTPSHAPFIGMMDENTQAICQLQFVEDGKIIFLTGEPYRQRQAYLLNDEKLLELDENIRAFGKSKTGNVFAIATGDKITTTQGWQGDTIAEFTLSEHTMHGITEMIPFNDGKKILLTTAEGIFILWQHGEQMIHPEIDQDDEEWSPNIDMENAALSNDNQFIIVADQGSDFRVLDATGKQIGSIGPQSSYPHYCIFSKNGSQLLTNSCHFYNGISIGVDTGKLNGILIPEYEENGDFTLIDEMMRVYSGVATSAYYILGDAHGYIRAINGEGKVLWGHHLGSSISGMAISDDEQTLWVGSHSGMLHKLALGKGQDGHTIGNGNHAEEFRIIFWKTEPKPLFW